MAYKENGQQVPVGRPSTSLYGSCTVSARFPHGFRYGFRTVSAGNRGIMREAPKIYSLGAQTPYFWRFSHYPTITSGHCADTVADTVRTLCGHCVETVQGPHVSSGRPLASNSSCFHSEKGDRGGGMSQGMSVHIIFLVKS